MTTKNNADQLAKELGLNPDALTKEDEVEIKEQPQKSKKSGGKKKKQENKETTQEKSEKKMKKRVADLSKEGEIFGVPVNHLQKPITFNEDGEPEEIVVTFNKAEVEPYRDQNGRILLEIHRAKYRKKGGDKLKVIAEFNDGKTEVITETNNHSRGWKRAKTWAMLLTLAFDPDNDVKVLEMDNTHEVV